MVSISRVLGTLAVLAALPAVPARAQDGGTVAGRVTAAESGAPLAGVSVTVQGTTRRTVTDAQGEYRLPAVPAGTRTLTASLLGRSAVSRTLGITAGQTTTADFALAQGAVAVEGLVVTATGRETRERELGNAVASITAEDVPAAAVTNVSQFLQGRTTGVTVLQSSGQLGSGSRVRIRGSNSLSLSNQPLVIVDGVRINSDASGDGLFTGGQQTSRFEDINPEDIESIEVLKGPAASSLYGTQAANGVIQITTRRGRAGRAEVRGYAEYGSLDVNVDFPSNYRARGLNAAGTAVTDCDVVARAAGACRGVDSLYVFNPLRSGVTPFRTGYLRRAGGSVSGGGETATYYVAAEDEDGAGAQRPNNLRRTNLRANVSASLSGTLRVTASSGYVQNRTQLAQSDNSAVSPLLQGLLGNPAPGNVASNGGYAAPLSADNLYVWQNGEQANRFLGSLTADWRPLGWLAVNGVLGVDQGNRFVTSFVSPTELATFFPGGFREQYRLQDNVLTANGGATATWRVRPELTSTTSAGVQYTAQSGDWTFAAADEIAPGTITGTVPSAAQEGFNLQDRLLGVYVTEQLAIRDRLFLTGGLRADQSVAFGNDIGWVTYPSLGASWVVREEPFFPQVEAVSNLRLRAAYGKSGVRPGRLDAAPSFSAREAAVGDEVVPGFVVLNFGNAELEAEVTREIELGLDLGLFEDRVGVELTHYDKRSQNSLVARTLPGSLGGPLTQFFNLGQVSNRGVELALRLEPLRSERLTAGLGVNLSTNRNRLITFGDTSVAPISVTSSQYHVEGYPLGGYWAQAYTFADTMDAAGARVPDGLIQRDEVTLLPAAEQTDSVLGRSYLGSPLPRTELGLSAYVNVGRWARVTGLLDYRGGYRLQNQTFQRRCANASGAYCEVRQVAGAATLQEQAAIQAFQAFGSTAGFIDDASFWKLREVSVQLSSPRGLARRLGLAGREALGLTLAGRNLATWTDYRGLDPEVNTSGATNFSTADYFSLPPARQLTVRVDVNF